MSARASLAEVLKRERHAIQRMRKADEAAAVQVLARKLQLSVYFQEREDSRSRADQTLDSTEKSLGVVALVAGSPSLSAARRSTSLLASVVSAKSLALLGKSAGNGKVHDVPLDDTAAVVAKGIQAEVAEEIEDPEALAEANIAMYDKLNVHRKIASLQRLMASSDPPVIQTDALEPESVERRKREMRQQHRQIRNDVRNYQALMRGKLDRLGTGRQRLPDNDLQATNDPSVAVREALSLYHQQCLLSDSYYPSGTTGDGNSMDIYQREEIQNAVAALALTPASSQATHVVASM